MSSNRNILVNDIGPAGTLVIPVQPGGTVLHGYCGTGKSITLEAIALGLGSKQKGRVAPRSGTKRGTVDCLGVMLSVSAGRITRNGDPEVGCLEDFDVGSLIDPPVKDTDARNRHAIKSLLRITGAEAKPELFHDLVGGAENFKALVPADATETDDLVEMAGRVKRALEGKARRVADAAEKEEIAAAADRNATAGLDLSQETNAATLQTALEEAAGTKSTLDEQARAAKKTKADAEAARQRLAQLGQEAQSTQAASEALELAKERRDVSVTDAREAKRRVENLEAELRAAKSELGAALVAQQAADDLVTSAESAIKAIDRNKQLVSGWQAAIDAAADAYEPSPEDLQAAGRMVEEARKAIERAAVLRAAQERAAKCKAHQEKAAELRKEALRLRDLAKGTDGVLSDAVASTRFSVEGAILLGTLPDGEQKPYFDLSDGERTMIALAEKIDQVRRSEPDQERLCIIDLPQRTFQDIPASVREASFAYAAKHNTAIITAQVTDDPTLTAIPWEPGMFQESEVHEVAHA